MRIIKKGKINKDKFVIFTCNTCGCEFSAAPDEYLTGEVVDSKLRIFSCCPDCHKVCVTIKPFAQEQEEEQNADN